MSDDARITEDDDDLAGLSDAELRQLGLRARAANDEPLRRLVASYISLRTLAAEMVTFIETREGAITVIRTPIFQRLKDVTRRRSA